MSQTSKKKKYTEDVVLNKIFKDISDENIENPSASDEKHKQKNTYEENLIKHYRKKDALEARQKYINLAKIIAILIITIGLIVIFTNYIDMIKDEPTQSKKTIITTPKPQPKVEKVSNPAQVEPSQIKQKEIITIKTELKKVPPAPIEKPVKEVKTEREIAKEMLLQQMKN